MKTQRSTLRALRLAAVVMVAGAAAGHDLWLSPATHTAHTGQSVPVAIRVGHAGQDEILPRDPQRVVRLDHVKPDGRATPAPGPEGGHPATIVRCEQAGLHQVVYRSNAAYSELPGPKFTAYLKEEGLDEIVRLRTQRGESDRPGRERYSRSVKALLWVGPPPAPDAAVPPPVGLPLEIHPQRNPFAARPGDEVALVVLWDGKPLAGALVSASPLSGARRARPGGAVAAPVEQSARSDESGRVAFKLAAGEWLVTTVRMQPAAPGGDAEWESVWSATSFEVGSATAAAATPGSDFPPAR